MFNTEWESVIGLEIHAQLSTKSKIFSGASTTFGAPPNVQACAIDLGLPGVLPVLNGEAVRMAVKFGLAVSAEISRRSIFARKNYFYPDLPKGYQISQYELPVVGKGHLSVSLGDTSKTIGITRAHLEEDAGKSLHEDFHGFSGIDLNRAGTPLLEIVSEPDMRSAREAVAYLKKIHMLVKYLDICDGNMQEGSLRCDANVSVRRKGTEKFGTRAEIKNLNSFRFIERAIEFEIERQIDLLERGGKVVQETRLYDPDKNETRALRSKEEANDYRYFPDPDLLPLVLEDSFIDSVRSSLLELPDQKKERFILEYGISPYDATVLTATREIGDFYEATVRSSKGEAKLSANWVMGDFSAAMNQSGKEVSDSPVTPEQLGQMIHRIVDGTITGKIAKEVFEAMWSGEGNPDDVISKRGLRQVQDHSALEAAIDQAMTKNTAQVTQYRAGKDKLFGFFVGQIMKITGGKANPSQLNDLLTKKLKGEIS
ncbi:Aspartyl/glutamyl-tRNA(Asn/Gln) amidotransferase subunit B [Gammaproteobacteria bacterium]